VSDYDLESIREHADFMWKNKHLAAIPKAKVDENGMEVVEVGSHRKGIVEELEKAHIYIATSISNYSMLQNSSFCIFYYGRLFLILYNILSVNVR